MSLTRSGSNSSGKLFFTIGLPQSGKSTFANDWVHFRDDQSLHHIQCSTETMADIWRSPRKNRLVLGGDDFRHALTGHEYTAEAEGTVFAMMDVAARALLRRGFDVLIDETSTTETTLRRYLKIDPLAIPFWINTPTEECKRRAREAGRDYLLGPIDRMASQLARLQAAWGSIWAVLQAEATLRKAQDLHV